MPKRQIQMKQPKAHALFVRGDKDWQRGKPRSALQFFLAAAKAGDRAAQLNVGYFYDNGIGTKRSRSAALSWYKRAYLRGDASAANNIGAIWRDEGKSKRARLWFLRAIKLGNSGSNLEVAKGYIHTREQKRAIPYLEKICASQTVSEETASEAKRLLRKIKSVVVRK